MTQPNKAIPPQITSFIQLLKAEGFYKLYDIQKGAVIYHKPSNSHQPTCFIHDLYYQHTHDASYSHIEYVLASMPIIGGFTFNPKGEELERLGSISKLNTYRNYQPSTCKADCPLFIELLERLVPDNSERRIFIQWLAHMIQRPEERPSWAVMLTSEESTGKGLLYNQFINPLVCKQAVQCANYRDLMGSHATALANTLFVMLDDTKSKSDSLITELKSKISEPEIMVNPKFQQPYTLKVFSRVLLASNEKRPIKLTVNDTRRWFVPAYINHKVNLEESQAFAAKVVENNKSDLLALDKVYNYLNNVDLSDFNPFHVAPTDTLLSMVELSRSAKEEAVMNWITDNKVFKLEQLNLEFNDYPDLAKSFALDYTVQKSIDLDGKRSRWWIEKGMNVSMARAFYKENSTQFSL